MAEIKNCTNKFYPELCGVNVIVDPQLTVATDEDRVLIIGQKSDLGVAGLGLNKVVDTTRNSLFGADSMLNAQIDDFYDMNSSAEVWAYVLPNNGTSGLAEVTITGVDTATASGVVYLWVNGQTYQAAFDPAQDTNDDLAAKLQAVISSQDNKLIVTVTGNVISIETKIKGEIGGFLDVRTSYSRRPEQRSSAEITIGVVVTDATGLPDLSALATENEGFEFVINPYTDDNSIENLSAYLCGQWSGGVNSRGYGVFYGDASQAQTFGGNTNNALISYMAIDGALTPSYLESSSYGALIYNQLNTKSLEMAASMTGKLMPALLAPENADEYTPLEKATLIENGMGYFDITRNDSVIIGRAVTTYTVNDNGVLDYTLRDVNAPAQIAYMSRYIREMLVAKYTGYAFRRDGIGGPNVVTIAAIRNYVVSLAQDLSNKNIIQDLDGFVGSVEVSLTEEGCVQITVSPELVDQFCCLTVVLKTK